MACVRFGVVCAFATDSQIESGAAQTPDAVRRGVRDARVFLNATAAHARYLLVDNYGELEAALGDALDAGGRAVLRKLDDFTSATSVRQLSHMAASLERVPGALRDVQRATADLRARAEDLNAGESRVLLLCRVPHSAYSCLRSYSFQSSRFCS